MQLQTVHLQRVFDVQPGTPNSTDPTNFSVETSDGKRHLALQLPGLPRLQAGDMVTAVLQDADDWQTLLGWRNHATGEIVVNGHLGYQGLRRWSVASIGSLIFLSQTTSNAGRLIWLTGVAICALFAISFLQRQRRAAQVRELLERQP